MKNCRYLSICSLVFITFCFQTANAITLFWYNDFDNSQNMYDSDGVTLLQPGDFVQLIRITSGVSTDPIDFTAPDAVDTNFHQILDTTEIVDFGLGGGEFDGGSISLNLGTEIQTGDNVFVRIWNAPSPNLANQAPISLNGISPNALYGNSSTFTITSTLNTGTEDFLVPEVVTSIPEPTTIAVLLMGVVGLVGFRKHLRK